MIAFVRIKFCVVILASLIISELMLRAAFSVHLFALVVLPGTFFHELAHFISALVLGGSPSDLTLIPSGNSLGSVRFSPTWYNAATVALAPLLLAPLTAAIAAATTKTNNPLKIAGGSYLAACSWVACTPSQADIRIALEFPTSWPLAVVFLCCSAMMVYKYVRKVLRF